MPEIMMPPTPLMPILIMCSNGLIPIMRGFLAKSFYFDGEPMTTVLCYTLGQKNPFDEGWSPDVVKSKENGAANCRPDYGIKLIILFSEKDKTLNKFEVICQKLKSGYLVPGETSVVQNNDRSLDCGDENVMTGLETKRDGDKYTVTAHCQKLKAPIAGPSRTIG